MKTNRKLRVSGLNDYVAVDLVNESGKIIEPVFYFATRKPVKVLLHDVEERKWIKHNAIFDNGKLTLFDIDLNSDFLGSNFEIKPEDWEFELCDKNNIKPLL